MVEEEILGGGLKGGGKEKVWGREWVSLNILRTFKHIQGNLNNYYNALILNSHHDNITNKLGKWIIPSCKIHMMEEETLGRGPKGRGKKELGEGEWALLNILSLKKTKIWQDYSTSLELKKGKERRFLCVLEWRRVSLYNSGGENINGKSFNES